MKKTLAHQRKRRQNHKDVEYGSAEGIDKSKGKFARKVRRLNGEYNN